MKKTKIFMVGMYIACAALGGCALDGISEEVDSSELTNAAPIASPDQLEAYLQRTPSSPFDRLSPEARKRFMHNLGFSKAGVSSFAFEDLRDLSATEVSQLLGLFGLERNVPQIAAALDLPGADRTTNVPGDRIGYRCAGTGTCLASQDAICTPLCWHGGPPTFPF